MKEPMTGEGAEKGGADGIRGGLELVEGLRRISLSLSLYIYIYIYIYMYM